MIKKNILVITKAIRLQSTNPQSLIVMVGRVLIIVLSIFCLDVVSYGASNVVVYLETNKSIIEKGEEVEIGFNIKNAKTAAYYANIYFDETKFEFISGPENIKIEENKINIVWYDLQGGSGAQEGNLGKVIFKAIEEGSSDFVIDGEFFNDEGQLIDTNFEAIPIQIGKQEKEFENEISEEQGNDKNISNANLKNLEISEVGLVPAFDTNIYEYDVNVQNNIDDIEILAISENPNAKVEIVGNIRAKRRKKSS